MPVIFCKACNKVIDNTAKQSALKNEKVCNFGEAFYILFFSQQKNYVLNLPNKPYEIIKI